ncbi:universal stress protein [Gordonia soli]|uniref:UspA domain-containing protein n=1 Tax=Gordonia soli NBRC 108243 TaxID=1223545 RepID=M0QDD0_9ACTN|nr:universal stress protein [Gordonia soli]GAC66618.1 hypothetical protein GS4_03_00660 [Gordonia soli NBRC 108243]
MRIEELLGGQHAVAVTGIDRPSGSGPIILGYNGSDASMAAIEATARLAGRGAEVAVVSAVVRRGSRPQPTPLHDVLKAEAYLLSDHAAVGELVRRGRETAVAHGLRPLEPIIAEGDPVRALVGAVRDLGASTVVIGRPDDPGRRVPGPLARALRRHLPDDVDIVATDGRRHVQILRGRAVRSARGTALPRLGTAH